MSANALATAARTLADIDDVDRDDTSRGRLTQAWMSSSRLRRMAGRTLALFLGSNIGNFDPPAPPPF